MIIPRSYAVPADLCQNEIKSCRELFRDVVFAFTRAAPFVAARVNYGISFCCREIRRHLKPFIKRFKIERVKTMAACR